MAEMGSPFALSASEEKQFADMEAGLDGPVADDLDDIAERDADAASDIAAADTPEADEAERWRAERKVPFKVFDAERKRARDAETEKQQYIAERARLQERIDAMSAVFQGRQAQEQAAAAPAPVVEEVPDPDQDVFATVKYLQKKLAETEAKTQQTAQSYQQQYKVQITQAYNQAEQQFAAQNPDHYEAINWAKQSRYNELMHFYALQGVPQQQAHMQSHQQIERDAYALIEAAMKGRHNPAEAAYRYALSRGYTPKQAQAAADATETVDRPRDEAGKFVAQRDPKLDQVAAAQARNKSLSNTAGQAGKVDLTVDRLAKMSDKEFKQFLAKDEDNEAFFKAVNGR